MRQFCHRCGIEVQPPSGRGHMVTEPLYYDIPSISETHLCADCVLDLMASDPTADSVMRFVFRTGESKPYYSQHRPDRYPFGED